MTFKLPPQLECLTGQPRVEHIGVGATHDARAAVRASPVCPGWYCSTNRTDRPRRASDQAVAAPISPAPITIASNSSELTGDRPAGCEASTLLTARWRQRVKERDLTSHELLSRGVEVKPLRPVDLRELLKPSRSGGHSSVNVLLLRPRVSKSPGMHHTLIIFPPGCRSSPSGSAGPGGAGVPISSKNSRLAAARGSSLWSYSPFGIHHAPSSFLAQNGPPICPSSTSSCRCWVR